MGWLRILTPGFDPDLLELPAGVVTLGRREDSPLRLAHDTVSGRHCDLAEADGLLTILDHGSTNGTYINGERIERGTVAAGEMFQLGGVDLCYEVNVTAENSTPVSGQAAQSDSPAPAAASQSDGATTLTPRSVALKFTKGDHRPAEPAEDSAPEPVDLDYAPTINMPAPTSQPAARPRSFALKFTAGDHRPAQSNTAAPGESPAPPPA